MGVSVSMCPNVCTCTCVIVVITICTIMQLPRVHHVSEHVQ